jgi:hypothetical protein
MSAACPLLTPTTPTLHLPFGSGSAGLGKSTEGTARAQKNRCEKTKTRKIIDFIDDFARFSLGI